MANSVIAVIIVLSERYNPVIAAVMISIVNQEIVTTLHIPAALTAIQVSAFWYPRIPLTKLLFY